MSSPSEDSKETSTKSLITGGSFKRVVSNPWFHGFILNIVLTCIYLPFNQRILNLDIPGIKHYAHSVLLLLAFIIPVLIAVKNLKWNLKDIGLNWSTWGFIGGLAVYSVPLIIFLKFEIFTSGYIGVSTSFLILQFVFIFWLALSTDFWFHGFLFLGLKKKTNFTIALISQNIYWVIYHIDEISALTPYIGMWSAIGLTIFLGIIGDLVAWKSKSVVGLMVGHCVFNLIFILVAFFS